MRRLLADFRFRVRALFDGHAQRDLDDELRFHLDMDAAALRAQGLASADADRLARRQFGSMRREAAQVRYAWVIALVDVFAAVVRHARRQLRRRAEQNSSSLVSWLRPSAACRSVAFRLYPTWEKMYLWS